MIHRRILALAWIVVCTITLQASSGAAVESPEGVESLYVVEFTTGPAWMAGKPFPEQAHASGHSANLRRLRREGTLVLGARHGAKGMVTLRSASEAAARAEIDMDPTATAGVFVYTLEELRPFYGCCVETPSITSPRTEL
jgi:uncharacterized protein YciI